MERTRTSPTPTLIVSPTLGHCIQPLQVCNTRSSVPHHRFLSQTTPQPSHRSVPTPSSSFLHAFAANSYLRSFYLLKLIIPQGNQGHRSSQRRFLVRFCCRPHSPHACICPCTCMHMCCSYTKQSRALQAATESTTQQSTSIDTL